MEDEAQPRPTTLPLTLPPLFESFVYTDMGLPIAEAGSGTRAAREVEPPPFMLSVDRVGLPATVDGGKGTRAARDVPVPETIDIGVGGTCGAGIGSGYVTSGGVGAVAYGVPGGRLNDF